MSETTIEKQEDKKLAWWYNSMCYSHSSS